LVAGDLAVGGELDAQGNYAVDLQNIPDMLANGPGYWFDGVDDRIVLTNLTDQFSYNGSFSILFMTGDDVTTTQFVKGGATPRTYFMITGGNLTVTLGDNTAHTLITGIAANTIYNIVVVWTDTDNDGDGTIDAYVNGVKVLSASAYTGLTSFPATMDSR